jgi:TldD protein
MFQSIDPADVSPEEKVSMTLDANKVAWINKEITSAMTMLGLSKDSRLFISSEGARVKVETTLGGLAHESIAKVNGVMERVLYSESIFVADISELAIEAASSKTPLAGTYPVVVDPEVVGLLLHEAFGHASEGDVVFTGESVLHNKLGVQLASELVTIVDEGIVEKEYFCPFDDEGTRKDRTVIVENGALKNYIHDRNSALRFNAESTGNGRAQNFEKA